MASKNVPAPRPGAVAYSVVKAGLTQMARVAAVELNESGIHANVLRLSVVFDTAIWTDDVLSGKVKNCGLRVEEYKT